MTFYRVYRTVCLLLLICIWDSCAVDPLEDQDTVKSTDTENPESIKAWVWVADSVTDSVYVYHTLDKQIWESFTIPYHADAGWLEGFLIGGGIYPTWWTFTFQGIYSVTNGILDHGDHGHIVHPYSHYYYPVEGKDSILSLAVSSDRKTIAAAMVSEAQKGSVLFINYLSKDTVRSALNFIPQKLALLDSVLIIIPSIGVVQAYSYVDRAQLQGVSTPVRKSLCYDVLADTVNQAFWIACDDGLFQWKMGEDTSVLVSEKASGSCAVQRFISSGRGGTALGIPRDKNCGDKAFVIHMVTSSVEVLTLSDAQFAPLQKVSQVDISEDGSVALLADLKSSVLYKIDLVKGYSQTLAIAESAAAVALNYDGSRAWYLSHAMVYQVSFDSLRVVDSIPVSAGAASLWVSSFADNGALYDSDDHTF